MNQREPFFIETQGLVLPGHADHPVTARAAAEAWLKEQGVPPFYAALHSETAPAEHAWWNGAEFVQAGHDDAEPVTVVMIPAPFESWSDQT